MHSTDYMEFHTSYSEIYREEGHNGNLIVATFVPPTISVSILLLILNIPNPADRMIFVKEAQNRLLLCNRRTTFKKDPR